MRLTWELVRARAQARSPIEERLIDALYGYRIRLYRAGVHIRGQFRVGRWSTDLYVQRADERGCVVECDGAPFHTDVARDARRDKWMRERGFVVLRFSGSRIYNDAEGCAAAIVQWCKDLPVSPAGS